MLLRLVPEPPGLQPARIKLKRINNMDDKNFIMSLRE